MKTGIELISEERKRQVEVEHWTAQHDAELHTDGELAAAGACYALWEWSRSSAIELWPWDSRWLKATQTKSTKEQKIRNLSKAGALIAAEIDRLQNKNQNE